MATVDVRHRIDVPNSMPRSIKFVGLGEGGTRIACQIVGQCLRNVEVLTPMSQASAAVAIASPDWSSVRLLHAIAVESHYIAKALQGANMVFLVATVGDDVSFAPLISAMAKRMGVLVTGIVIQKKTFRGKTAAPELDVLRTAADMLIISSDESYVTEMLGALGA